MKILRLFYSFFFNCRELTVRRRLRDRMRQLSRRICISKLKSDFSTHTHNRFLPSRPVYHAIFPDIYNDTLVRSSSPSLPASTPMQLPPAVNCQKEKKEKKKERKKKKNCQPQHFPCCWHSTSSFFFVFFVFASSLIILRKIWEFDVNRILRAKPMDVRAGFHHKGVSTERKKNVQSSSRRALQV